jgi:deoxyribonuclease-4
MPRRTEVPDGQCRFGAHVSIAGGLHTAFDRAVQTGCEVLQVFVKNQRQWKAPALRNEDLQLWRDARAQAGLDTIVAHDTYLINLAAPDEVVWRRSIDALLDELTRCQSLGISGLVTHPGCHMGIGEVAGIRRIAQAIDLIHEQAAGFTTRILLEITAGQGSSIGHRFAHIADILGQVRQPERLGVCFDTCHAFAAGYELGAPEGYARTMADFDQIIGLKGIACFHMNDSRKPLGSRVDRHEAIGKGCMGREPFRNLINDPRFAGIPMILETPKGQDERGRDLDRLNLAALRRLIARGARGRNGQPSQETRRNSPARPGGGLRATRPRSSAAPSTRE